MELPGSSSQSPRPRLPQKHPEVRPLPSTGITRLPRYYGPLRLPPRPPSKGRRCGLATPHLLGSPTLRRRTFPACRSQYSGDHRECSCRFLPRDATAFPANRTGRRHDGTFGACSGFTARCSPQVCSICPWQTFVPGASTSRVTPPAVQVATGPYRQLSGWNSHPLVLRAFPWRTGLPLVWTSSERRTPIVPIDTSSVIPHDPETFKLSLPLHTPSRAAASRSCRQLRYRKRSLPHPAAMRDAAGRMRAVRRTSSSGSGNSSS